MKTSYTHLLKLWIAFFSLPILFGLQACKKEKAPEVLSIGAEVCMVTLHHERGLPGIDVYIKYNQDSFPGYDDLSIFDARITSDEFAEACFPTVPIGHHWFVGFGVDSLLNEPVRGSVPFEIHNNFQSRDTIIYVTEY